MAERTQCRCPSSVEQPWGEGGAALTHEDLLADLIERLETPRGDNDPIGLIGHRIVHGGNLFTQARRIDDAVLERISGLAPLAPLYQPHNIAGIRACTALRPEAVQVACFDTAFHRTLPKAATRYAVPAELEAAGVRRYGFHGLSYAFVGGKLAEDEPELASGRVIVAHLGNGASLCAMHDGRSLDTIMGFTPLDGLVIGTRAGSLDPSIVTFLMRERSLGVIEVEHLLYEGFGLFALSGGTAAMRGLLASDDPRAAEAVDMFVFRAARAIGGMTTTLGGLDGLVFTGGIGENSPEIRARIAAACGWLGAELDGQANRAGRHGRISRPASRIAMLVMATDEEQQIARESLAAARGSPVGKVSQSS